MADVYPVRDFDEWPEKGRCAIVVVIGPPIEISMPPTDADQLMTIPREKSGRAGLRASATGCVRSEISVCTWCGHAEEVRVLDLSSG